jgi:Arc/MetJ-type ribon-helix-helix transcriptional regulator
MVSVQIRFPVKELKRIDSYVEKGEFSSRAEFIRDAVRKAEMLHSLQKLREIIKDEGISEKELIEGGKEVRKKLFKEMFGEN